MAKENNDLNLQVINLIAKETLITGSIISEGDLRIDGEIQGDIEPKGRLVIGETGKVEGNVNCRSCEISGTYKGKITVTELLSLKASAIITGEIYANKLSIEPGASFIGTCNIHGEKTP